MCEKAQDNSLCLCVSVCLCASMQGFSGTEARNGHSFVRSSCCVMHIVDTPSRASIHGAMVPTGWEYTWRSNLVNSKYYTMQKNMIKYDKIRYTFLILGYVSFW